MKPATTPAKTLWPAILLLCGAAVRGGWLGWQPLWWDEGYSVYFATESLPRLLWLTAYDIHPPLYYLLLHGWIGMLHSAQPVVLRLFSLLTGLVAVTLIVWLGRLLYPARRAVALSAAGLLVGSPLHLFYSHEVRMYGLALLWGLLATGLCWQLLNTPPGTPQHRRWLVGYALAVAASLYTLYYLAPLVLAHLVWALWYKRRESQARTALLLADGLALLLYLPWLVYAVPKLVNYVTAKIPADADRPLGPLTYVLRHLRALTAGHLPSELSLLQVLAWSGLLGVVLVALFLAMRNIFGKKNQGGDSSSSGQASLLWCCCLVPVGVGFVINRTLPFFPAGGERLLLFVLPYFLLLMTDGLLRTAAAQPYGRSVAALALLMLLLAASGGVWTFYTQPRYAHHDYRPLIGQIVQQGADADTLVALFPWEVGYWRAYAPATACRVMRAACIQPSPGWGPQPRLLGEGALVWNEHVRTTLDQALAQGTLWLPATLSLGSTLPAELESYLANQATNLENRWYSPALRLSAWARLSPLLPTPLVVDYGPVRLQAAGYAPIRIASANQPIHIALQWATPTDETLGATIRLVDRAGQVWASRSYTPIGGHDSVGFLIPAGLPPDDYDLMLGIAVSGTQSLLTPVDPPADAALTKLGVVTVTTPDQPLPPFRLPIQQPQITPWPEAGVTLLGVSGNFLAQGLLAGEAVAATLFLQASTDTPALRALDVRLVDASGASVAGWQGWSLPQWPAIEWSQGVLVQAPLEFFTPATLPTGRYQLFAAPLTDPGTDAETVMLGGVTLRQRTAIFAQPPISNPLPQAVQFGSHIQLLGYQVERTADQLQVQLHWQVLQPLLPPHHLFVHWDTLDGITLAQHDGPPHLVDGLAPTGTWQPGEYLITTHQLSAATAGQDGVLRVGLYLPETGVRLPATSDGAPIGDAAVVPLGR